MSDTIETLFICDADNEIKIEDIKRETTEIYEAMEIPELVVKIRYPCDQCSYAATRISDLKRLQGIGARRYAISL